MSISIHLEIRFFHNAHHGVAIGQHLMLNAPVIGFRCAIMRLVKCHKLDESETSSPLQIFDGLRRTKEACIGSKGFVRRFALDRSSALNGKSHGASISQK